MPAPFSPYVVSNVSLHGDARLESATRWVESEWHGFSRDQPDADAVTAELVDFRLDGRKLIGVYPRDPVPGTLDESHPVGTLSSLTKTLNVGGDSLVDAYLIASVTVSPAHRRRGLFHRLMIDALEKGAESRYSLAALTATQAGLYRRYGFGIATRARQVELDTRHGFSLETARVGTVRFIDWARLQQVAPDVFRRHHDRTVGSVNRTADYWRKMLGAQPGQAPDPSLRAAVHFSDEEAIDGYVSYRIRRHDDTRTIDIHDLVAESDAVRIELWQALAALDMVGAVRDDFTPADDALALAAVDPRLIHTRAERDVLWLRILDPASALTSRRLQPGADLTLRIRDDLGYANGTYRVAAADHFAGASGAVVEKVSADSDPADLEMDVSTLSSLYLGATTVEALAAVGHIRELQRGAVAEAGKAFRTSTTVQTRSIF